MDTSTDNIQHLDIWMDGECGLCQRSREWCKIRDRNGRFHFIDFRTAGGAVLPLTREDHETSMWVQDCDGNLLNGFSAWRRIMSEIPGWRWVARLLSLPPFTLIGPRLYRLVASNRHRVDRF